MPILRAQERYRRSSWQAQLSRPNYTPPKQERWIPSKYIKLSDAIEQWGAKNYKEWSGFEKEAYFYPKPPDAPWVWNNSSGALWNDNESMISSQSRPTGYFIFDESNQIFEVTEEEAKEWWQKVEPTLLDEWKAGNAAHKRWIECKAKFRELLANGNYSAQVLNEDGTFFSITTNTWLSTGAEEILKSGKVSLSGNKNGVLVKVNGPVVFLKNFMEKKPEPEPEPEPESEKPKPAKVDYNRFPYFLYMNKAIIEAPFEAEGRTPKKKIEAWLRDNWPDHLGKPTDTKVSTMATFLRRPEDEGGGNHGKASDD